MSISVSRKHHQAGCISIKPVDDPEPSEVRFKYRAYVGQSGVIAIREHAQPVGFLYYHQRVVRPVDQGVNIIVYGFLDGILHFTRAACRRNQVQDPEWGLRCGTRQQLAIASIPRMGLIESSRLCHTFHWLCTFTWSLLDFGNVSSRNL